MIIEFFSGCSAPFSLSESLSWVVPLTGRSMGCVALWPLLALSGPRAGSLGKELTSWASSWPSFVGFFPPEFSVFSFNCQHARGLQVSRLWFYSASLIMLLYLNKVGTELGCRMPLSSAATCHAAQAHVV
jgi:hypothetical protein